MLTKRKVPTPAAKPGGKEKAMKIIKVDSGEVLAEIVTNHSMTLEQACDLMDIKIMHTEQDYQADEGYDIEDLELVY